MTIVILHLHAESILGLFLQFPADATHAQDAQDFPLRIMAMRRGRGTAAPKTGAQSKQGRVEEAKGAEKKKEGGVRGSGIDRGWRVRDLDSCGGAGWNVDLIVAGAW